MRRSSAFGEASSHGLDVRGAHRWWAKQTNAPRHEVMLAAHNRLHQRAQMRNRMALLHMQLYSDMPIQGLGPYAYMHLGPDDDRVRLPLIKYITDRYVSFWTRSFPKILALTSRGPYSVRRRGKGITKWLEGKWDAEHIKDEKDPLLCLHTATLGTGLLQVIAANLDRKALADVEVETVPIWELTLDEAEAQNPRKLRQLFRRKWVDRDELMDRYPGKKRQIRELPAHLPSEIWGVDPTADLVPVVYGWRLPSREDAGDGACAVAVQNGMLEEPKPWLLRRFPFVRMTRSPNVIGYWGIGIPQELRTLSMQVNQMWMDYEEAISLGARPRWLFHRNANVQPAHVDDEIGRILEWSGAVEPRWYTPGQIMPGDFMEVLKWAWQLGGEIVGLSDMRLHGELPPGLRSGAAVREANQVEDSIFTLAVRSRENAYLDLADLMIDTGRMVAEVNPKFASTYSGKREIELVYFRDVLPKKDAFVLKLFPVSSLSSNPSQRLEQLAELFNTVDEKGERLIDSTTFRALLDYPDLENESSIRASPYELASRLIERFLTADDPDEEGVYVAPEDGWDLAYMSKRFLYEEMFAFLEGVEDRSIDLLRKFRATCDLKIERLKPPPALPSAPGASPPQPVPNQGQAGPQPSPAPPGPMLGAAPVTPAAA